MRAKNHRTRKKRSLYLIAFIIIIIALIWHPIYSNVFLKTAYPQKYASLVDKYSQEENLDPNFVYSIIRNESSFNPDAVSGVGARGLMQITPDTFNWAMSKLQETGKYTEDDLYTPEVNIKYGTFIISSFLQEFGDERTAVAAYHAGRGNVNKWLADKRYSEDGKTLSKIPFKDTTTYVDRVEKAKKVYTELY